MKYLKKCSCFILAGILCASNSFAAYSFHKHENQPLPATIEISAWAQDEVSRAMELGFGPVPTEYDFLPATLNEPVSRGEFCAYSARLIAFQQNCDEAGLTDTVLHYYAEKDSYGQPQSAFADVLGAANYITAMHYLDVAKGRGNNRFAADEKLTRQEAATFLARIYKSYGGALDEGTAALPFSDADEIADWAKQSVAAMYEAEIMKGYEDGRFAPHDLCSYEQCLLTLLRLYENMPTSRKTGNVAPLFTYEQYFAYLQETNELAEKNGFGTCLIQQVSGPEADFVQQVVGSGSMHSVNLFRFVYHDGGIRSLSDFGVCDTGLGWLSRAKLLQDPHFSEDGQTFYCTITLKNKVEKPSDVVLSGVAHSHEAGIYQIAINIKTLDVDVVKISDIT